MIDVIALRKCSFLKFKKATGFGFFSVVRYVLPTVQKNHNIDRKTTTMMYAYAMMMYYHVYHENYNLHITKKIFTAESRCTNYNMILLRVCIIFVIFVAILL